LGKSHAERGVIGTRAVEIIVAFAFIVTAAVVIWDSRRLGVGWGADGPESGFFPFYVGLIMLGAASWTLAGQLRRPGPEGAFVRRAELRRVLEVLIPTAIFVVLVGLIGIYAASFLLMAWFMRRMGGYGGVPILAVGLAVPLACFALFEVWFLVPLPKGPLETWLGY